VPGGHDELVAARIEDDVRGVVEVSVGGIIQASAEFAVSVSCGNENFASNAGIVIESAS
jgi:hypothetical protein